MEPTSKSPIAERELILERVIAVPAEKLYRAWTEPDLLCQWFCPAPWYVSKAELDVKVGGSSLIVMNGPQGEEFPNRGLYLCVIPNQRLVFTDAFTQAWEPSERAFMVGDIQFTALGHETLYRAVARHWSVADTQEHEKMGFHQGWSIATDQLTQLAMQL